MGTGYQEVPPCSAAQNVSLIVLSLVLLGRGSLTFAVERQVRYTLSRSAGFFSMASGLSRDLPTVIDTPRREGRRFCPYEYYSDATPSPLSRTFVISNGRAR